MKLSTRVRYGVRALIELAKQDNGQPMSLREIARRQEISPKYLEQMISSLKNAGLVRSVRGAEGGYRLGRSAEQISVWDIYSVLDIAATSIDCIPSPCDRIKHCGVREVWSDLYEAIADVLKRHTIAELAKREIKMETQ